ncbi:hypothetical protein RF11_09049 [Thelohanellus kitauei]|uniref:Uncharacterized protein n=1 Tax=Thelohanellus kitauei TaxID=669202 RepID=A0A0C2IYW3_THEKT|nr:hypothetical protein RF11_09049 [Thelohanellus kitauei]
MRFNIILFIHFSVPFSFEYPSSLNAIGACYRIMNSRKDHWVGFKFGKDRVAIPPYFRMKVKIIYRQTLNLPVTRDETIIYHLKYFNVSCKSTFEVGYGHHRKMEIEFKIYLSFGVEEYFYNQYNFIMLDRPENGVHGVDSLHSLDLLIISFQMYRWDVIYRPDAALNIQELDFGDSTSESHSCIVVMHLSKTLHIKYKNLKPTNKKRSTSIIMELKIFKNTLDFPGSLLYEFNFTGFRRKCGGVHIVGSKIPHLAYPEKWKVNEMS